VIFNILVCGVGGQGVITFGRLLSVAGLRDPKVCDVVGAETRGVAQREGITSAVVRWNLGREPLALSPVIPQGQVHLLVSLEAVEVFRYLPSLNPDTVVLADTRRILPKTVLGNDLPEYPPNEELEARLHSAFPKAHFLDAHKLSTQEFNTYQQTAIILFSTLFAESSPCPPPIDLESFRGAVQQMFPGKAAPLQAIEVGRVHAWR